MPQYRNYQHQQKAFGFERQGHRYDNIQNELNAMNERELTSEYAQKLMDEAAEIRKGWK